VLEKTMIVQRPILVYLMINVPKTAFALMKTEIDHVGLYRAWETFFAAGESGRVTFAKWRMFWRWPGSRSRESAAFWIPGMIAVPGAVEALAGRNRSANIRYFPN